MGVPETLNVIGLSMNFVGAILICFFGLPQPSHAKTSLNLLGENTEFNDGTSVKSRDDKINRTKAGYTFMAVFSCLLMALGFALQLVAVYLGQ